MGKASNVLFCGGQTAEQDFVSIVSVYNHEDGGVLQLKVMHNKKISEIEVARELIDNLKDLPSRQCFTLDALHAQTSTVEKIIEANHNYLIAVKENQPKLYQGIEKIAATCQPRGQATTREYSHGRFVRRQVSLFDAPEHLQKKWKALKTLIRVERHGIRDDRVVREIAYYLSDEQLSAQSFLKDIQGHWSIENQLHWVKDVTFTEDAPPRRGGYAESQLGNFI